MRVALDQLRCVITGQELRYSFREDWTHAADARPVGEGDFTPAGATETLAVTADERLAYPVVDDIPVLVAPEALAVPGTVPTRSVDRAPYQEAYLETDLYSSQARDARANVGELVEVQFLAELLASGGTRSFPDPAEFWLRSGSTVNAQYRAFRHLAPTRGTVAMQLGGWGYYALLLLAAGAERAYVVSPFPSELLLGRAAAEHLGVEDRLELVAAFAEELPFTDGAVERIYSPGSIHHTVTTRSFSSIQRVLAPGGRFASLDVWKAPLHGIGTKIFGKCHGNIHCHPLEETRLAPVHDAFDEVSVSMHGAVARYPLAIAERLDRTPSVRTSIRLADLEDRIAARSALVRRQSSVITICATK